MLNETCPTCGGKEPRKIRMIALGDDKRQMVETMHVCRSCGVMFDPQYPPKRGIILRMLTWLSRAVQRR